MLQREGECCTVDNMEKNTYVKKQLTAALVELLGDKELRDISVSEIAAAAGVHRVSFYRNYGEKEDILREYILKLFGEWTAAYDRQERHSDDDLCMHLFAHLDGYRDFYLLLSRRGLLYLLRDALMSICVKPEYPNLGAYAAAFIAGGLYGWIEEWVARGMQESAQEMAVLLEQRAAGVPPI